VLDTNVVSELRKAPSGRADPAVTRWGGSIDPSALFLSVVGVQELEMGVLAMERRDPRQGAALRSWLNDRVLPAFERRILPIDVPVALRCAGLHVPDQRPERDALIAATALVHGMIVATRNVADFAPTGVRTVDPWSV